MDVECEVCRGNHFYIQDGRTYCERCNSESQAHGHETVVDDETLGTFQAGMAASLKTSVKRSDSKSKHKSKRRSSKYLVAFTSIDAFTFILKGWTNDLIELGAPPALSETVKLLWCNYLKKIDVPFGAEDLDSNSDVSIGIVPSFRDFQTKITGRKRLISATNIAHMKNRRSKMSKLEAKKRAEDFDDEDDDQSNELEVRRKRQKRRRKFINSLISEDVLTTSDTDASRMSFDSSHRSDKLSLSFSSMDHSSTSDTDTSYESSSASMTSDFSSDAGSSTGRLSTDESDNERKEVEAKILEKISYDKRSEKRKNNSMEYPRLALLFSLLSLALSMTEGNRFTLSDLIYWADRDSIAYKTSVQHLPSVMQLRSREDKIQFTPLTEESNPLDHFKVRQEIARLGAFMGLEEAIYPEQSLDLVVTRLLKDLSLPAGLAKVIKRSLKKLGKLLAPTFSFGQGQLSGEMRRKPFLSLDLRALGLILFALKYLYGLDDQSELYRSADARKFNENNETNRRFVICDWIQLSRRRAFFAVRYCSDLYKRFQILFPRVQMSSATLTQSFHKVSTVVQKMHQKIVEEKGLLLEKDKEKEHICREEDTARLKAVRDFIHTTFEKSSAQIVDRPLELSESSTPLLDMSNHFVALDNDNLNCELDTDEIQDLSNLLKMATMKIGLNASHPDAEEVEVEGDWFYTPLVVSNPVSQSCQVTYSKKSQPVVQHSAYYSFDAPYWRRACGYKVKDIYKIRKSPFSDDLLASFPENFAWILKYFSAYAGVNPVDIYNELNLIETEIYENEPGFFGLGVKSATHRVCPFSLWKNATFGLS